MHTDLAAGSAVSRAKTFPRRVEPEWLDELSANDPRALRSRRDLRRVNAIMLQAPIMMRALMLHAQAPPRRILDLGTGDGTFMLKLARRLAKRWPDVTVTLLDRQNIVSAETRARFGALGWSAKPVAADVFQYLQENTPQVEDIVTVNLFLHHFRQDELAQLLRHAASRTRLFVACEPERNAFSLVGSKLLWAIGCNDVSRHDAAASVRAGFRGRELSALWPNQDQWQLYEAARFPFTHCFVASRIERKTHDDL
jgi:2-polyprenyl-3-methyl-5-hydroxy-6-metoxy-1,4-benzoquinol methylase